MAQRIEEELSTAWRALADLGMAEGWRTISVSPCGPSRLMAGRHQPGNEEALLVGFSEVTLPAKENLPQGRGFSVERVDLGDSRHWLALSRDSHGSAELFRTMVFDLVQILHDQNFTDELVLLRAFLGRIRAWQDFMRQRQGPLPPEAELGLAGELTVLRLLLENGLDLRDAVKAWEGPIDGIQDFLLGDGAIEVKATLAATGFTASIGSLEQLDDSVRQPIFLAGVRFALHPSGQTLPDIVLSARARLARDTEAAAAFEEKLLRAGYLDAHAEYYIRRLTTTETRILKIGQSFPRLYSGNVPLGVLHARYEIDLSSVASQVTIADALKAVGIT